MDDDDYDDYSDEFDDFDSDGDVLDDEEEDENQLYGGDEEEYQDQEEEEEDGVEEEEEEVEVDGMDDYEDDEEILEYGEQLYDDEDEIVEDLEGVEIEDEVEEDLVEFDDEEDPVEFDDEEEVEEGEEEMMEEGEEDGGEEEFDEEEGDEEDDVYGNESSYEDETEPDDEFETIVPIPTRLRSVHESSYLSGYGGGFGGSRRNWRGGAYGGGTATTRPTENNVVASEAKVVESTATGSSGSNDLGWNGFQGPVCPICYENWTGEGRHCVCCLPCGHLYGLSCITIWLLRPNSQKCPQCNHVCELEDVRRLYGMQLQISGVEELQQKVKSLEAKCASLELKDADWLKKEAEWQKREADLKQRLNQHKEAEAGLVNNTVVQGDTSKRLDPVDKPEPSNALSQMKL